jgi:hypothetical protein
MWMNLFYPGLPADFHKHLSKAVAVHKPADAANELPRGKPRGIKDRNPQELRGKLRGIYIPSPPPRFPRFARASARAGFSAEGKRKRDKSEYDYRFSRFPQITAGTFRGNAARFGFCRKGCSKCPAAAAGVGRLRTEDTSTILTGALILAGGK